MRRKDQPEQLRKKQIKQEWIEYTIDTQISILLPYIKIMPITIQKKFILPLKQIIEKQNICPINTTTIDHLLDICASDSATEPHHSLPLIDMVCRFLRLNKLRDAFITANKQIIYQDESPQLPHDKNKIASPFQPFEPSYIKQITKFEPIESIINPNYQNITKFFKNFTDAYINMQYKIKDLNQSYTFFAQPRFISKLLEIRDYQSNFPEKGNIIMMNFQGSKIVGKRGFAFINQNAIYWWEKNYKDVKQLLIQLTQDKQKQAKDKDKKKQFQKDELKNQSYDSTKYHQNFKLSYKMVGHHGKIIALSLSHDQYYLISAGTDKVIKLWCLRQKCLLTEYRGHLKTIWSVSFSKSGYFFLSGSADKTIKLWSTDDSIAQRVFIGHHLDVIKVNFMENPDFIISSSEDKTLKIWNTLTTQCLNTFKFDTQIINFKSTISGRYLLTCSQQGKLSVFDLLKGQKINSFQIPQKQQCQQTKSTYLKIHDLCISLDQKQFTCISSKYIIIYSFDKICQKKSKNIFNNNNKQINQNNVNTKEVIYTGRDSNLVYCHYVDKGLLLVATTSKKKY